MTGRHGPTVPPVVEYWQNKGTKPRRRSRTIRRVMTWTLAVLTAVLLTIGMIVVRWFWRAPSIGRNFTAEHNAAVLAAKPELLAWPEIRRAKLDLPDTSERLWTLDYLDKTGWTEIRPGNSDWAEVRAYVQSCAPQLGIVRNAATRPMLGYLLTDREDAEMIGDSYRRSKQLPSQPFLQGTSNPELREVWLHYMGTYRSMARLLRADARVAIEERDPERVIQDIEGILGLSRQSSQTGGMLGYLLKLAVENFALCLTLESLEAMPDAFADEPLRGLDSLLSGSATSVDFDFALKFERDRFLDALQRSFSDDGSGSGEMTLTGVKFWDAVGSPANGTSPDLGDRLFTIIYWMSTTSSRAEQIAQYDAIVSSQMSDASIPIWEYDGPSPLTERLRQDRGRRTWGVGLAPALVFVPSLDSAIISSARAHYLNTAVRATIAIHRYRGEEGRWPESLATLVPKYIANLPLDRFTGKPLLYRTGADGPVLYSTGINRIDDGGIGAPPEINDPGAFLTPSKLKESLMFKRQQKPGWDEILFPPSRAKLPAKVESENADQGNGGTAESTGE